MRYDYDFKDILIEKLDKIEDFSGYEKLKEFHEFYKVVQDDKNKNLLKFLIYKLSALLNNKEIQEYDCDVSKESMTVFKKAYSWLNDYEIVTQKSCVNKFELKKEGICFRGDTMTSAWVPLVRYLELKGIDEKLYKDKLEDYLFKNINEITISKNASDFLRNTHTIGNFIPVPKGFNVGRSNFGRWDSWDLTLQQIYLWYQDNKSFKEKINNNALNIMFSTSKNKDECIFYCVEWLKMFSTWNEFVDKNYLRSFVDMQGKPILFFKGHSFHNYYPKTQEESEEFFMNVNSCIIKRGIAISEALGNKVSIIQKAKTLRNHQRMKNMIHKKFLSKYDLNLIEGLKEHPIKNLDVILLSVTKWVPILYSIILLILYIFNKDKENGLFFHSTPYDYFMNNYFILLMLSAIIFGFFIAHNKFIEDSAWKYKKTFKMISYIGGYGICISIMITQIWNIFIGYLNTSTVGTLFFNQISMLFSDSVGLMLMNLLILIFNIIVIMEVICCIISIIVSFKIKESRRFLYMSFYRIGLIFITAIALSLITFFIDYWKDILGLGIATFIVIGVIAVLLSEDDDYLRIVDKNDNEVGRVRKMK